MTPKKRTPRKKANENPASASPSRKRKRVTKAAAAEDEEEEDNSKEEEDFPEENNEPLAESAIEKETGLDAPDPSLHPQVEDQFPNADTGKNDPEWTENKGEDADSDTDQLSK